MLFHFRLKGLGQLLVLDVLELAFLSEDKHSCLQGSLLSLPGNMW